MPFRAKANVTLFEAKNGTKQKLFKQRAKTELRKNTFIVVKLRKII